MVTLTKEMLAIIICLSLVAGLALPFGIDWMLFGDATPCATIQVFEDGSSVQKCSVRG